MTIILFIIILFFNIFIFHNYCANLFTLLVVASQSTMLLWFVINFIIFIIKRKIEILNVKKITRDDWEKFNYYRDILKSYSIGELGYLYLENKDTQLLIAAELENLKRKKLIDLKQDEIIILNNEGCYPSEKYIIDHYRFINDKEFYERYLDCIKDSLKEKGCLTNYEYKRDSKIIIIFALFIMTFFLGWYLFISTNTESLFIVGFEAIYFCLVILILLMSFGVLGNKKKLVKTKLGKEIFLKLCGLKNYLRDFNNFDEKNLKEIVLWEDYILYAIILKESKNLSNESKNELDKLINYIYK